MAHPSLLEQSQAELWHGLANLRRILFPNFGGGFARWGALAEDSHGKNEFSANIAQLL